jgi:chemotaxis protein MotD
MTGAIAAAGIAKVEPRMQGRKDPGKGQSPFDAAMNATRPVEQAGRQARASSVTDIASAAHRKTEAEAKAEETPDLAEVLQSALRPATARNDIDEPNAAGDQQSDDTDTDDAATEGAGWMNQARFDAAIWKALGPDAGSGGGMDGAEEPGDATGIDTASTTSVPTIGHKAVGDRAAPLAEAEATADVRIASHPAAADAARAAPRADSAPPPAPVVGATEAHVAGAAAILSATGSEQRGTKTAARDSERAQVKDLRAEPATAPSSASAPEKARVEDRARRSADDQVPLRTDAADTGRSSPEHQAPDMPKPAITTPAAVTQQPQQQLASPAGSVVAALSADPAWSAYFRDTQPGAPAPVKSLKIQLNPSELGVVTAHLLAGDDGLSVELVAETVDAQNKLASDSDLIARSLRAIGLDVDRVTVQLASRNDTPTQADGGQPRGFASESGAGGARGDGGRGHNGQSSDQSQSMRAGQQANTQRSETNSGRYI